ncbi:MAG: hypothetical protein JXL80_03300 [Planctomycetes bacterium]|nr:hypothetical protein [Planctomycetota bacterium]
MSKKGRGDLRRALKWFCAVLAAIVVLALFVRAILVHYAEKDLASVKAKLSFELVPSRDLPTLWGSEPLPDENAAPLYVEIERKLSAILYPDDGTDSASSRLVDKVLSQGEPVEISPLDVAAFLSEDDGDDTWSQLQDLLGIWGFQEYYGNSAADEEFGGFADQAVEDDEADAELGLADDTVPPRDVAAARKFLTQFAEVLKLRDEAVWRPLFREPLDWTHPWSAYLDDRYVRSLDDLRDLTLLESVVAAQEGRMEEAYNGVCTLLLMARHLELVHLIHKQHLAAVLRCRACELLARLLAQSPPPGDTADRLRDLLAFDAQQRARSIIVSEAAFTNGAFESETDSDLVDSLFASRPTRERLARCTHWANKPSLIRQHARVLETMDAYYEATGEAASYRDRCEAIAKDFTARSAQWPWRGALSLWHAGDLPFFIVDFCMRAEATGAMATVAFDVVAYRESNGRYPVSLSELPDRDGLPRDPFSGKALLYRPTSDGFVLWSVGPDGDDDGGKSCEELGRHLLEDGDIVLRVPPVDPNCEAADGDTEKP